MPHRHPHKPTHHIKPNYKRLALIAAAVAMLSATPLTGTPALAHASAADNMSASTSQQVGKTDDSSSKINMGEKPSQSMEKNKTTQVNQNNNKKSQPSPTTTKTPVPAPKAAKDINENSKSSQPSSTTNKTPVPTPKAAKDTTENNKPSQSRPATNKAPLPTPKAAKDTTENNKPSQSRPTTNKAPLPTPKETKDTTENTKTPPPSSETKSPATSNAPNDYKKVLDISATAYAPGPHDNEQWGNKTYTGTQVRPGIIAVDPKIIPLGSRVYIEYPDGHGEYATAEDTGGAIKGNRVDIAKQTVNEAEDFGIQKVKVYVVNTPKEV